MNRTIEAIFDGMIFRPLEPLELPPNTRVQLTISTENPADELFTLAADSETSTEPPEDTSEDLNKYIYENYVYSEFYDRRK